MLQLWLWGSNIEDTKQVYQIKWDLFNNKKKSYDKKKNPATVKLASGSEREREWEHVSWSFKWLLSGDINYPVDCRRATE